MAAADLVDITTACASRGLVSVVGVVVDRLEVFRTRGSSACVTFTIKDTAFDAPSWHGGLKIKYFNDNESFLPDVRLNDAVLLRKIRLRIYQNKPMGVASQYDIVPWAIFRHEPDPSSSPSIMTGPDLFQPTSSEKSQALALLHHVEDSGLAAPPPPLPPRKPAVQQASQVVQSSAVTPKSGGLPFTLFKDAQDGRLAQLIGQVVKINTYDSEKCILHITDYTENPALINHKKKGDDEEGPEGDQFNHLSRSQRDWPGPWGQMTLQVTLWEPHAGFARDNLSPNDLVLLTYAHVKIGRGSDILEAAVHEDKRYPEKIHLKVVTGEHDYHARELLARRKEYWRVHGSPTKDPGKANKRKNKNQQKKQPKKKESRIEEGQQVLQPSASKVKQNPHVKVRDYQVPPRSIEYILSGESHINTLPDDIKYTLPFQNVCYRSIVRVIDFFPPNLEDFTVAVPSESILDGVDDNHYQANGTRKSHNHTVWEWRFCLLVEGGEFTPPTTKPQPQKERMKLFVTGAEAEHLLRMDAEDLRRPSSKLEELREKLFHLWGDLEELKRASAAKHSEETQSGTLAKPSSLPFTCCIKEYGVPCSHEADPDAMTDDGGVCPQPDCFGWVRRFAMWGTTINS